MSSREDGRVMCKNGHEQAGIVDEQTEHIVEGSTRRRVKTGHVRYNKFREARKKRLYGAPARFMIVEAFQLILQAQVAALVANHGAPEDLVGVVRHLWMLYVSKLPNIDRTDEGEAAAQDFVMNSLSQNTQSYNRATTMLADVLFTQHTQSQRFDPIDDSLDIMLRRVDDDIARDEEDMLEWDREFQLSDREEPDAASPARDKNEEDEDESNYNTSGNGEGRSAEGASARSRLAPKVYGDALQRLEKYPKMEYLPVILCLGYRLLRMPVLCADMFRLLADERVPYLSAFDNLPKRIHERIGVGYHLLFKPHFAPSVSRMLFLSNVFGRFFAKHYSIDAPLPDVPSMLLSLLKRLGLGIEVYSMVVRLLELVSVHPNHYTWHGYWPELVLLSAIVVVLKLHYGLDEIERRAPPGASYEAPNLPSLRDFLDKWRSDWEAELTVGVFPHLTAFGDEWEAAFADGCRRLMSKREIGVHRKAYKEIAVKYRRMVESLAAESDLSAERAKRVLPPEYAKRFDSSEPALTQTQSSTPVADPAATSASNLSRLIQPILLPRTDIAANKRPLYTLVEPFYNHPEIQLEPGELYVALRNRRDADRGPGYMIPTLGLVYARCAALVGCSQTKLDQVVVMLERKIEVAISRSNDTRSEM
ncbi:hypothetical protein GGF42_007852 [Coemansia sp. RSA 2424]|nr:hypothetical protein GGF42_007852 [Coemansia sp. RSA 2424]